MEPTVFFHDHPESKPLFDAVWAAAEALGPVRMRVSKSQIKLLASDRPFAWLWVPGKYLLRKAAPLVLSFSFRGPRPWFRWKEIYRAAPGRFTHHLELWSIEEFDLEAREWLRTAWEEHAHSAR
jgi:hypothetical protein